jgi:putative DNA primase/helicase
VPVTEPTAYMMAKGIAPQPGALTDRQGIMTYIEAMDAEGKVWGMQYIQEDGTKRFAKDSRKEACFHPVGGMKAVAMAPALVIAEGYATAVTLSESLGQATVAAFDSGNLVHVARALHEKFPDKPVIIAGDDDRHLELTLGSNPGRSKAEEAARAVSGKALFPIFAPGEQSYPDNLAPVTPELYRRGEISGEQQAALNRMKQFTDFNDLANQSALGRDGVNRQVNFTVEEAIERSHAQVVEHQQQHLPAAEHAQQRQHAR